MSKKFKFISIISYISVVIFLIAFQVFMTMDLVAKEVTVSYYLAETIIVLAAFVGLIMKKPFASLLVVFLKLLLPDSNLFLKELMDNNLSSLDPLILKTYIGYVALAFYFFNIIILYFALDSHKYKKPRVKHLITPLIVFIFVDIFHGGHEEAIYIALPELLAIFLGADLVSGFLFLSVFSNIPFVMAEEIPLGGLKVKDYIYYVLGLLFLLYGLIHLILEMVSHAKKDKNFEVSDTKNLKSGQKVLLMEEDEEAHQENKSEISELKDEPEEDTNDFEWF